MTGKISRISVVIPARDAAGSIENVVRRVREQSVDDREIEVVVVDDGSHDRTAEIARATGARTLRIDRNGAGNPAAARNRGAAEATGDAVVFLDADCIPVDGWLQAIVDAHEAGAPIVGGALDLPPGLPWTARCDYYIGWYYTHSGRPSEEVPHHPPPNLSVRRELFLATSGFSEAPPLSYTNEERAWLAELRRDGHAISFEPKASVLHHNRPGVGNLLRRSYRWGYTAIEAKSASRATRAAWLFSRPLATIAAAPLLPLVLTVHILMAWSKYGRFEPIVMTPVILASRIVYVAGMVVGGVRWLQSRGSSDMSPRPAPRWQ